MLEIFTPFCRIAIARRASVSCDFLLARSRSGTNPCGSATPRDQDALNRLLLPFTSYSQEPAPRKLSSLAGETPVRNEDPSVFTTLVPLRWVAWIRGGCFLPLADLRHVQMRTEPLKCRRTPPPSNDPFGTTRETESRDRLPRCRVNDTKSNDRALLPSIGNPTPSPRT